MKPDSRRLFNEHHQFLDVLIMECTPRGEGRT
jgi:hypothetical protein